MRLAKNCLDVGLFTTNLEPMLEFWQHEVGLPFEELLPVGGGVHQHRHGLNGSVLKINSVRGELPDLGPSGYRELFIVREGCRVPKRLTDPDGNHVTLIPPGYADIETLGIRIATSDMAWANSYYGGSLGWEPAGDGRFRCGTTRLLLEHDESAQRVGEMRARGYRYLTVQVWDCDAEHVGIVSRGGTEGRPPATLGSTARISFVRDPDGNWLEVSQRASLTGPVA
jgi:lactoylglutathione lyase